MTDTPKITLGIEEEYAIIDPETRGLKSHINTMLSDDGSTRRMGENILFQPELHQAVVELATPICHDIDDARRDLVRMRRSVIERAEATGAQICAVATHPFSDWKDVAITDKERYVKIVEDMGDMARANLIFGLHVHVGVPDMDTGVELMNEARYFLPHLLALSTSSPFWLGRRTGLKSTRSAMFRRLPRTGIPSTFASAAHLRGFVDTLIQTGCIPDGSKIWWDIRAHHKYPTVEWRICDLTTTMEETLMIVALVQAITARLRSLRSENQGFRLYSRSLIEENKWRAMREGVKGRLIDFGKKEEVPFPKLCEELIKFVDPVLDGLGCRKEAEYALHVATHGSSADRQIAVWEKTGSLQAVVDMLIEETRQGVFDGD